MFSAISFVMSFVKKTDDWNCDVNSVESETENKNFHESKLKLIEIYGLIELFGCFALNRQTSAYFVRLFVSTGVEVKTKQSF